MKSSDQKFLLALCFLTMTIASIPISLRGLLIPTFKVEFGIDNTFAGIFISASMLFSVGFSYLGGIYISRIGQKRLVQLGCAISLLACILIYFSKTFILLTLGFSLIASGMSLIVLGLNTVLTLITFASGAVLMNLLHFFYGVGSTATQKIFGLYDLTGYSWRNLFLLVAALFIVSIFLFEFKTPNTSFSKKMVPQGLKDIKNKKLFFTILLAINFYILSEFLACSWIFNYLTEGFHLSIGAATLYTTIFFFTFTLGRLVGGFILQKLDILKSLSLLCFIGTSLIITSLALGIQSFILIGISGICYSTVYPSAIAKVSALFKNAGSYAIAIISAASSLFIFTFNIAFGLLNDIVGVKIAFYMVPISLAVASLLFYRALHYEKEQEIKNRLIP